jgi:hypothetical protein
VLKAEGFLSDEVSEVGKELKPVRPLSKDDFDELA